MRTHEQIDVNMYLHLLQIIKWTCEQMRWKCAIKVVSSQVPAIKSSQVTRLIFELNDTCPWSWSCMVIEKIKVIAITLIVGPRHVM